MELVELSSEEAKEYLDYYLWKEENFMNLFQRKIGLKNRENYFT
jgi:hypothetical protein